MSNVTVLCFFATYLLVLGLEWLRTVRPHRLIRPLALVLALAGLVAHTFFLLERSRQSGLPPLLSSTRDWLLVLAWLGAVLYVFLGLMDRDLSIGLFLFPLVLALIGASHFVSVMTNPVVAPAADAHGQAVRHWVMLHASLLVFGIGFVVIGLVLSLMYLVQHRRLKQKHVMHDGLSLPSLEKLARLNWWAVMISIPLLVLGMLTGIGLSWFKLGGPVIALGDPVVVGNGAAWTVMAIFFCWLRFTQRPAGKQVAWLTIWAFGLLLVTLVGLQVLSGGHFAALKHAAGSATIPRGNPNVGS